MITVLALVHADGHVRTAGKGPLAEKTVARASKLLDELGLTGWHLATLRWDEAVARYAAGRSCAGCEALLPCGCLIGFAYRGGCPHGGYDLLRAAAVAAGLTPADLPAPPD